MDRLQMRNPPVGGLTGAFIGIIGFLDLSGSQILCAKPNLW
ncbi:hypothetical protein BOS5A_110219 [Bosea sp. EC-HK365B]|nr:hypothetical protein BOSE21B_50231 [Bosea sp. 21B]CAD5301484.1 hypothetical protein BOSE7B_90457 [Bosea sp. 7B]VVT51097.1 hypothetical protein BOS5A_110219 [Bosea sp. EC-HK365B]VXB70360.1 hypothetical protein BOSE127_140401 [Bosea sp. 127]